MKRKRLRIRVNLQSTKIKATYDTRPKEYMDLRYWWLHECARHRAKGRVHGVPIKKELRVAQKELARLREEHCQ